MVSDEVKDRLREKVEDTARSVEWAVEQYEEAYEDVEDRLMEDVSEERKQEFAIGMVESEQIFRDRVGGGEEMQLDVLAVGQAGKREDWGQENRTVVYAYATIYGPLGEDGKEKAGDAVLINVEETGMDLDDVRRKFHALNTMQAVYEVNESDDLADTYVCWSNGSTELVETDLDSLPADPEEKKKVLRHRVPEATLATLHDDMSAYDPDSGYTRDFGADIRRIEAKIVDRYVGERDDGSRWGRYTVMDDSVTEEDIVDSDLVDEEQNVPGLTVWMGDPDYHGEFGRKSRVEIYGTVEENEDGILQMNMVGAIPIIPMPVNEDDEQADSNVNSTENEL